jgi:hypothetical protein
MSTPGPILVSHLFPELRGHFLVLLRSLSPEEQANPSGMPQGIGLLDYEAEEALLAEIGHY